MAAIPPSPVLSDSQLERIAAVGEERTAEAGEVLYAAGARDFPFIAIIEGGASMRDGHGNEVFWHRPRGFIGEVSLLTGQTAFLTAVTDRPTRYIAVTRDALRRLIFDDGPLGDLILATFIARREALQGTDGVGFEIIGPRSSESTRRLVDFARRSRLPHGWREPEPEDLPGLDPLAPVQYPIVRIPGGRDMLNPTNGEVSRALGIGLELSAHEDVDVAILGAGPAGLGAAVYAASEGLSTILIEGDALGGQAGTSRLIENYLGFPAGLSGSELTTRAIVQARKFGARSATPYRVTGLTPGADRHIVHLDDDHTVAARTVVIATGVAYRRLPVEGLADYEGVSVFYAAGPPESGRCVAARVGVVGGGNAAGQAAIWLAKAGALVTLLHRRSSLGETMSDYLIHDLDRHGVVVRDRSEVAALHGADGELEGVTLTDGERLGLTTLFLFIGATPCTSWLSDAVRCDDDGFILTGAQAGAQHLFETSVPGVYAAGDVRSGSIKRCATAVGEGANVVSLIHGHLASSTAATASI